MQISTKVKIVAIVAIALMEINAMAHGVNGVLLNISMCIIAAIAGTEMKSMGLFEKVMNFWRKK